MLSVVIPARNEEAAIAQTINEIRDALTAEKIVHEIIVVDDGSTDATGQKLPDINSGLRVFRKEIVFRYMHTISNGFSFTPTITLASMLNGYFVTYVPIEYFDRLGKSYVRYWRDSLRTLQIIVSNIL